MDQLKFESLDLKNDRDVALVAEIHCKVPKEWDSGYTYTDSAVDKAIDNLKSTKRECYVVIARNVEDSIIGLHWVQLDVQDEKYIGIILSLWVDPQYRPKGVATNLKHIAESWLRLKGAREIRTNVFLKNKNMIALNEKLGYKPVLIGMAKSLE